MNKSDLEAQVIGLLQVLDGYSADLDTFRKKEVELKLDYEKGQERLGELTTRLIYEIASQEDMKEVGIDPRTGIVDEDWAKLMTQIRLQEDERYVLEATKAQQERELYERAIVASRGVSEKLGAYKTKAILLASFLRYVAGDEELS